MLKRIEDALDEPVGRNKLLDACFVVGGLVVFLLIVMGVHRALIWLLERVF